MHPIAREIELKRRSDHRILIESHFAKNKENNMFGATLMLDRTVGHSSSNGSAPTDRR